MACPLNRMVKNQTSRFVYISRSLLRISQAMWYNSVMINTSLIKRRLLEQKEETELILGRELVDRKKQADGGFVSTGR